MVVALLRFFSMRKLGDDFLNEDIEVPTNNTRIKRKKFFMFKKVFSGIKIIQVYDMKIRNCKIPICYRNSKWGKIFTRKTKPRLHADGAY